jgi:hypothetical protein
VWLQLFADVNNIGGRRSVSYFFDNLKKDIAFPDTSLARNDLDEFRLFFVNN